MRALVWCPLVLWIGCHATPAASSPPAKGAATAPKAAPPAANPPADDSAPASPPPTYPARVTIHSKTGASVFDVELALDEPSQERGLMFRKQVPSDTGMLFVFPSESHHIFWMKNTLVPLDMLFLSKDRRIAGIIENAEPLTTSARDPHVVAKYVLEVAGGTSFARGFKPGDLVDFENVP
jgi:uncharacterized membrane protein (UPF0127 family)